MLGRVTKLREGACGAVPVLSPAWRGWHVAAFVLDAARPLSALAADRLHVGAPVSIGFRSRTVHRELADVGVRLHTSAALEELSTLGPNDRPVFAGAEVMSIVERPRTRTGTASRRTLRREVGHVIDVS